MEEFKESNTSSTATVAEQSSIPISTIVTSSPVKNKIAIAVGVLICVLIGILIVGKISGPQIPSRYLEVIKEYKSHLKDPSSMRIYGDIIVANFNLDDGDTSTLISVVCDAKNSYGAYSGKSDTLIMFSTDTDPVFIEEGGELDELYIDVRSLYDSFAEIDRLKEDTRKTLGEKADEVLGEETERPFTFEKFDGKAVAKALGAEYYDA